MIGPHYFAGYERPTGVFDLAITSGRPTRKVGSADLARGRGPARAEGYRAVCQVSLQLIAGALMVPLAG